MSVMIVKNFSSVHLIFLISEIPDFSDIVLILVIVFKGRVFSGQVRMGRRMISEVGDELVELSKL